MFIGLRVTLFICGAGLLTIFGLSEWYGTDARMLLLLYDAVGVLLSMFVAWRL